MKSLALKARGKINLTLDVVGKRPDGYHTVEMILQSIELADELVLKDSTSGISLKTDSPLVPGGSGNLAVKAAYLLCDALGIGRGVEILLKKRIPVAAGLAGGSTDAAAVLVGLNRLWNLGLDDRALMDLGLKLGADVPFCIMGGTALAGGIGERLARLAPAAGIPIVLVKPPFSMSTAEAYAGFRPEEPGNRPDHQGVLRALAERDYDALKGKMANVLETVTIQCFPSLAGIKRELLELGASASLMSGSGPSVYGIFSDRDQAEEACARLAARHDRVFLTETSAGGIEIL